MILRNRKRNLRKAFDEYIAWLKWHRQHVKNIRGALYIRSKYDLKLMQRTYDAICFYFNRHTRAHRYWNKILTRMDCYLKKRAVTNWRVNAGLKYEEELANIQDSVTDSIHRRNQLICLMESQTIEQEDYILEQQKTRRNKAYRQLGNYFVRT